MTQITLFEDQVKLDGKVRSKIASGCKALMVQAETGSGKTILATNMIQGAVKKATKVHFIVPRKELLRQTSNTFNKFGVEHSYIASGRETEDIDIKLVSAQTVVKRLDEIDYPDVVFIDEAHYGGLMIDKVVQAYKKKVKLLIGLSATPMVMSGQGLAHQYDDIVFGETLEWYIKNRRLSQYRAFAPEMPDTSQININNGEFNKKQASSFMEDNDYLINSVVRDYKEHCDGMIGIAFAQNVKHSKIVAKRFNDAGIPAVHMDGDTPDGERIEIAKAMAKRELKIIVNVDLCAFGYDLASSSGLDINLQAMFDLQLTNSTPKQRQKNGRVLRYDENMHYIFDYIGNITKRHGLPHRHIDYTLEPTKTRKADQEKAIATKRCPKCHHLHLPRPTCPSDICRHFLETGERYVYPIKSKLIEEIDGELKEIKEAEIQLEKKKKRIEVGRSQDFDSLFKIMIERKYKPAWVIDNAVRKKINVTEEQLRKIYKLGGYKPFWLIMKMKDLGIKR